MVRVLGVMAQIVLKSAGVNLAESFPAPALDRPALIVAGTPTSYGDLVARADRWRGGLVAAGLAPGDRVIVLEGNSETFVLAYLACLTAGLVIVPLNPQSPSPELLSEMSAVRPAAVVVGVGGADAWASVSGHADCPNFGERVFVAEGPNMPLLDTGVPVPLVHVEGDHPAALLFTSGTAGPPKPAILTHENFAASMASVRSLPLGLEENHQWVLGVIPLFHVFGLNVVLNMCLSLGATLVLEDFSGADRTVALVRDNQVTMMAGPPALWASLLATEEAGPEDFASVNVALSGASKLNPMVGNQIRDRFGIEIHEGYGLTETSGIVSSAMATEAPRGSVGLVLPGVEVRIVNDDEDDVLIGDTGEIWVRGAIVSPGYWGDDAATASARSESGWLRTGDLAVVDDEGYIAIVDRLKDLIIVSGFNVHPGEVEEALQSHPEVALAAVVGETNAGHDETVVAYVVLESGSTLRSEDLRNACRARLARYKVPARVEVVEAIPTTAVGKIRRRDLGQN